MTRSALPLTLLCAACTSSWSQTTTASLHVSFDDPDGWTEPASIDLDIVVEPDVGPGAVAAACDSLAYELRLVSDVALDAVTLEVGGLGDGEGDTVEELDLPENQPHLLLLETDRFQVAGGRCEAKPNVVVQPRDPLDAVLEFEVVAKALGVTLAPPGRHAELRVTLR